MPWYPLVEEGRDFALTVVQEIADELLELFYTKDRKSANKDVSLSNGYTGQAVFLSYLAQALSDASYQKASLELLEQAIEVMSLARMPVSLYSGFIGIAWTVEHFQKQGFILNTEDLNYETDNVLKDYLSNPYRNGHYDLISGLVGLGVYALERLPRPTAVECLERVVYHLRSKAEHTTKGITWRTNPAWIWHKERKKFPYGNYNLGVAHGIPGVIAFLGKVYVSGILHEQVELLLEGAINWLLAQKLLPNNRHSIFPYVVGPNIKTEPARLAWCYGDLGVAAALLSAARCVDEPSWEREALEIARCAAERSPDSTGVIDACICHGAAGVCHLFNRIFQATKETLFKEAAQFWFRRVFELRHPNRGIAGFLTWMSNNEDQMYWADNPGILNGAAGIGLAILAAITPIEPAWDRMLLTDIPC